MATILVADDYPANRQFLVTLLGSSGHRVLEAADGAEALEVVRADPTIAQRPVIFYTGIYLEPEAETLARALGAFRLLTKPFKPEVILSTEDAALARSAPPPAPPLPPQAGEFNREHLRLLTHKLSQKVNELEAVNRALQESEKAQDAEARFLRAQTEVAQVALSSVQPEILVPRLLETIGHTQGYASGLFWRMEMGGHEAVVVASFGEGTAPFHGFRTNAATARATRTGSGARLSH